MILYTRESEDIMGSKATYYYCINDLDIVAKKEEYVPYLYQPDTVWIVDNKNIIDDRIIGYDGESIGSSDMLLRVDDITEDKVMDLI